MLRKLLKHDIKATAGFGFPILGAIALALVLAGVMFGFLESFDVALSVSTIMSLTAGLLCIGAVAANFVLIILAVVRFYTNLMTDEGYLMLTLPVTATEHIVSKLVTVVLFGLMLIIVDALALALAAVLGALVAGMNIGTIFNAIWQFVSGLFNYLVRALSELKLDNVATIILEVVDVIADFLFISMLAYFAMAVAGMAKKAKFFAGIGIYLGIQYGVNSILASLIMTLLPSGAMDFTIILAVQTLLRLTGAVVFFFATRSMLSKKLNLN